MNNILLMEDSIRLSDKNIRQNSCFEDKTIVLSGRFKGVDDVHLYKEPGEIPYWISRIYGYKAVIHGYRGNEHPDNQWRSVQLRRNSTKNWYYREIKELFAIAKSAKSIDILYLLNLVPMSYARAFVYQIMGGKGKIYLKCDIDPKGLKERHYLSEDRMRYRAKFFHNQLKKIIDIFTVETLDAYEEMKNSCYAELIEKERLFLLPNGFDPEILTENGVRRKSTAEKEKIMITVGRIGTEQKNTELLLEVLAEIDLKDWKVYCIGPIEPKFLKKIDAFYTQHPEKKNSVYFTGKISQAQVYEYYNASQIFLLTSRWEGYALALTEATYMNNYIISTDVGGAKDSLQYTSGFITPEQTKEYFILELQRIISMEEEERRNLVPDTDKKEITWEYILKNSPAIKKLISTK